MSKKHNGPLKGKGFCHEALLFTDGIGTACMPLEWTALWLYLHSLFESEHEDKPWMFQDQGCVLAYSPVYTNCAI